MQTLPRIAELDSAPSELLRLRLVDKLRVVAMGDSSVFGVGDTINTIEEKYLGWAGRLAHDLKAEKFLNLGKNGARFRTIVKTQLSAAIAMRPNIAIICIGTNDVLRGDFSPAEIEQCAITIIKGLRELGSTVVFVGIPDPVKTAPGPQSLKRILQKRVRLVNWITDEIVTSNGGIFISTWNHEMAYDKSMWHIDHMHPSAKGHQAIADLVRRNLGFPRRRKSKLPVTSNMSKKFEIYWLLTNGLKWFAKRSIDLVPALIWLVLSNKFRKI
jgi:lysophospholipase L1-like esterase